MQDLRDLAEGRAAVDLLDDAGLTAILRAARRIAVIGGLVKPGF